MRIVALDIVGAPVTDRGSPLFRWAATVELDDGALHSLTTLGAWATPGEAATAFIQVFQMLGFSKCECQNVAAMYGTCRVLEPLEKRSESCGNGC